MKAINLKVEYLNNPMGIDAINPRFCWNVDDCKNRPLIRSDAQETM